MPSYNDFAPVELTRLPFTMRRSQLYPGNLPAVSQAVEWQQGNGPEIEAQMPGRMAYQKWKNGPAAVDFANGAVSAVAALDSWPIVGEMAAEAQSGRGVFTREMAARHFNHLPAPNVRMDMTPVARGLLNRPVYTAAELDRIAATASDPRTYAGRGAPSVRTRPLLDTALEGDATPLGSIGRLGSGTLFRRPARGPKLAGLRDMQTPLALGLYSACVLGGAVLLGRYTHKKTKSVGWTVLGVIGGAYAGSFVGFPVAAAAASV